MDAAQRFGEAARTLAYPAPRSAGRFLIGAIESATQFYQRALDLDPVAEDLYRRNAG